MNSVAMIGICAGKSPVIFAYTDAIDRKTGACMHTNMHARMHSRARKHVCMAQHARMHECTRPQPPATRLYSADGSGCQLFLLRIVLIRLFIPHCGVVCLG